MTSIPVPTATIFTQTNETDETYSGRPGESTTTLKAFAEPVRLRLLNLLSEGREICLCHLHEAPGPSQPTVSRHPAYLRKHGLVVGRKSLSL